MYSTEVVSVSPGGIDPRASSLSMMLLIRYNIGVWLGKSVTKIL